VTPPGGVKAADIETAIKSGRFCHRLWSYLEVAEKSSKLQP
jgi:hypothetical protein